MTPDDVLGRLFPGGHQVTRAGNVLTGSGPLPSGEQIAVVGIVNGAPLAPDDVIALSQAVLDVVEQGGNEPVLVLVDTQGQLMTRHAEMIGLNEYCAHLAKCLLLASHSGHRTVGFEYGQAVAGAFLATALATDVLVTIKEAQPAVMDLPSIARVTKLPEDKLAKLAKTTPVFAPGVEPMVQTGAVTTVWDADTSLADQLAATLADAQQHDDRDVVGKQRGGRPVAADVAQRVSAALHSAA